MSITRREFFRTLGISTFGAALVGVLPLTLAGCGKGDANTPPTGTGNDSGTNAQTNAGAHHVPAPPAIAPDAFNADEANAYTATNPRDQPGKVGGHLPKLDRSEIPTGIVVQGDTTTIRVAVNHEMNRAKPHWIQQVYAKDAAGKLLDAIEFPITTAGAWPAGAPLKVALSFKTAEAGGAISLFERCNLHGLWRNEIALG